MVLENRYNRTAGRRYKARLGEGTDTMTGDWRRVVTEEIVGNEIPVCTLSRGEKIYRKGRSLILSFPDSNRKVLSSAKLNGGFFESPETVFNTTGIGGEAEMALMTEGFPSYMEYSRMCAEKVGINPDKAVGLGTAVTMDKAAVVTKQEDVTEVTAIVTAGVEGNGGRAGDPSSYDQSKKYMERSGTIVIILVINADLPESAMARAIVTATEAKTCALQQLMARSVYSTGIATGSGTDQVAIICDSGNPLKLTDAGKHSLLGELIGKAVIEAVLKALDNWAGLNGISQRDVLKRLRRYGVESKNIIAKAPSDIPAGVFAAALDTVSKDGSNVALVASVIHIQDEICWGLLDDCEGVEVGEEMIRSFVGSNIDLSGNLIDDLASMVSVLAERLVRGRCLQINASASLCNPAPPQGQCRPALRSLMQ